MADAIIILTPTQPPAAGVVSATHTARLTAQDVVDQLLDYIGADAAGVAVRACKDALVSAYAEFATAARWTYYQGHGRVLTNAPYTTGTVAFDYTGGTYERQLTLASGTWPDWVQYGSVRVGDVTYDVDRRISDTVVTLDEQINPGADLDAGTAYTLYRDTYTLPADFSASQAEFNELTWGRLAQLSVSEWLAAVRRSDYSGRPYGYAVTGDPRRGGRLALRLVPYPSEAKSVDFVYQRLPRALSTLAYSTGTVSVTADVNSTTTVTGSGTTFLAHMKGSVIRLSANTTELPTRLAGENPYSVERTIISVDSATSLTVDEAIGDDYALAKYLISDPVDVETGSMFVAFLRCAEKQLSIGRQLKDKPDAFKAFDEALIAAREADSRDFGARSAGHRLGRIDPMRSPFGISGADVS